MRSPWATNESDSAGSFILPSPFRYVVYYSLFRCSPRELLSPQHEALLSEKMQLQCDLQRLTAVLENNKDETEKTETIILMNFIKNRK